MISKGAMNFWFVQALKQQLEWLQKKKGADIKVLLRAGKQTHQLSKLLQFEAMPRRNYWKNAGSGFWTIARTNGWWDRHPQHFAAAPQIARTLRMAKSSQRSASPRDSHGETHGLLQKKC